MRLFLQGKSSILEKTFQDTPSLEVCSTCRFLGHKRRKNHDLRVAENLRFDGVCKIKNRLIGDFL
jgi:hypothetical protein